MQVPCPVCGASDSTLYLDGDDSEIALQSIGSSRTLLSHGRILRCSSCGLAYRSYRPKGEELARLYREADDRTYEAEMPNRWRTAERHRRIVERYVPTKGSLLDVGCASGAFLRVMQDNGWRIQGVEPSESQCYRASKVLGESAPIQQCILETASLEDPFDLVTLWDVLEHVTEPTQFLALAASHLKEGGYLVLNVPRVDSLPSKLLGLRWPLLLAEHLSYFTVPSLHLCGTAAGLKLIDTGQRPSSFSLEYVFFRAGQHRIPGANLTRRLLPILGLAKWTVPVWLGEVYAVFRKDRAQLESLSTEAGQASPPTLQSDCSSSPVLSSRLATP
jgi:SAM-dependent methyltransferase